MIGLWHFFYAEIEGHTAFMERNEQKSLINLINNFKVFQTHCYLIFGWIPSSINYSMQFPLKFLKLFKGDPILKIIRCLKFREVVLHKVNACIDCIDNTSKIDSTNYSREI